jgi:hypothetical protein
MNRSAAASADSPASTAASTCSRKSVEQAPGINTSAQHTGTDVSTYMRFAVINQTTSRMMNSFGVALSNIFV